MAETADNQVEDQALQKQIEQDVMKVASQPNNDNEDQSKAATGNESQFTQGNDQGDNDQSKANANVIQTDSTQNVGHQNLNSNQQAKPQEQDQTVGNAGKEKKTTDPLSLEGLEKLEKENTLSALDSFLATFSSAPSPASSSSMAESHASQMLQNFKAEVIDQDLLETWTRTLLYIKTYCL